MVKKDDVADLLIYGNGKPHQVSQTKNEKGIELSSYQYDANGNQTISTGARARTIDYNVNNQPIYIEAQGNAVTIRHDDAFERYFEKHSIGTKTIKYWKLGKQFEVKEVWENGNKTEELHNHYVGSRTLFQYYPMSNIKRWRYLHTDRLGSVETISDGNGNWLERNSYDPFGKVRQPNAMQDRNCVGGWNCLNSQISQRGFTGTHEHLDAVSVINMGGRIYDQELGRFLSVDPFMTSPLNAQSLNPYSYVGNSPLMGTDPTGYICALNARQYAGSVCLGDKPEQQGAKSTPMTGSRIRGVDTGAKCSGSCSVRSTNGKQNSQSTGDRNKPSHAIQLSGNPTASKTDEVEGGLVGAGSIDVGVLEVGAGVATYTYIENALANGGRALLAALGTTATIVGGVLVPSNTIVSEEEEQAALNLSRTIVAIRTAATSKTDEHSLVFFHGTNLESAMALWAGAPLEVETAISLKHEKMAVPGFYLATNIIAAEHFAAVQGDLNGGKAAVLQYTMSGKAVYALTASGAQFRPIPGGGSYTPGMEYYIPPALFPLFNSLRQVGEINVGPPDR